jgi:hypothetical protein
MGVTMAHHFHSLLVWNKHLFHMSNVDNLPNFVKQFIFLKVGKLEVKWLTINQSLLTINQRSCKLDVIDFLPFRSWIEKEKMKT